LKQSVCSKHRTPNEALHALVAEMREYGEEQRARGDELGEQRGVVALDYSDELEAILKGAQYDDDAPALRARQAERPVLTDSAIDRSALTDAAQAWWERHRPVAWTAEEHYANPTVNTTTQAEKDLAKCIAALRGPRPHE
jgi:hypothetical protein